MSNYELMNNVPPNVSLQRSSSDAQLSPGFASNIMQQQVSPNQRAPFSPQSNTNFQPFMNTGQRLSPQAQQLQQQQQQQMAFQANANANAGSQLSPRQAVFPQGTPNTQPQSNQMNQSPQSQQAQWNQSALNSRLSMQQQNNPMLNAQLQVSFRRCNNFGANFLTFL